MYPELSRPPTLSTVAGYELQAAGHAWDAVCAGRRLGLRALSFMGRGCGAVIDDPRKSVLYWFVPCGGAAEWHLPGTTLLSVGQHLVVPPALQQRGPGPHWHVTPSESGFLTPAGLLRSSLQAAGAHNGALLEAS